ncbi:MAG: hypothetical protein RLZZ117_23 [Cyanobacteriota bacterium]
MTLFVEPFIFSMLRIGTQLMMLLRNFGINLKARIGTFYMG